MHVLCSAKDGVNGARLYALGTANAFIFANKCYPGFFLAAMLGIERLGLNI
jgi:hypothetical protein